MAAHLKICTCGTPVTCRCGARLVKTKHGYVWARVVPSKAPYGLKEIKDEPIQKG